MKIGNMLYLMQNKNKLKRKVNPEKSIYFAGLIEKIDSNN